MKSKNFSQFMLSCLLLGSLTLLTKAAQIEEQTGLPQSSLVAKEATPYATAQTALQVIGAEARFGNKKLNDFYLQYPKAYVWIEKNKLSSQAKPLLDILINSAEDDLNPQHYHVDLIGKMISDFKRLTPQEKQSLDVLLSDAFLSYARDMGKGRPELKKLDNNWLLKGREFDETFLLTQSLANDHVAATLRELVPPHPEYQTLKKAFLRHQKEKHQDVLLPIKTGKRMELNVIDSRVPLLRQHLIAKNFLDENLQYGEIYDTQVMNAVKEFQEANGLKGDGIVGQQTIRALNKIARQDDLGRIRINMERWRWMPQTLGSFYLVVDITGFEYFIIKDGIETIRAKTVVGKEQRPTPVFSADMNHIVFSPYWNIPRSIAVKDKLPLLKNDPYRLLRSGIRVYRGGREIDPGTVDWSAYNARNFNFNLRQDPSPNNALGRVKFMFPNDYAIYLHDTPTRSLFNKKIRTYSSGCIRIENPIELAEYLLKEQSWDKKRVLAAYNRNKESSVRLKETMRFPVYILYFTAAPSAEGNIEFRPDIYGRDELLINGLKKLDGFRGH